MQSMTRSPSRGPHRHLLSNQEDEEILLSSKFFARANLLVEPRITLMARMGMALFIRAIRAIRGLDFQDAGKVLVVIKGDESTGASHDGHDSVEEPFARVLRLAQFVRGVLSVLAD